MEDISLSGNFIILLKDLSSISIFPAENSCDGEGEGSWCALYRELKKHCHHGQRGSPASLLLGVKPRVLSTRYKHFYH